MKTNLRCAAAVFGLILAAAPEARPMDEESKKKLMEEMFKRRFEESGLRPSLPAKAPAPAAFVDEDSKDAVGIPPGSVRLVLKDGSRITGKLDLKEFVVATAFGDLRIPASEVHVVRVGLSADPALGPRIGALVEQLGDGNFEKREAATGELRTLGAAALRELEKAANHKDEEVKTRAAALSEEIRGALGDSPPPRAEDEVHTGRFTVVGALKMDLFKVATPHGELSVEKSKVARMWTPIEGGVPIRVKIPGSAITGNSAWVKTAVQVKRGDVIRIRAAGSVWVQRASRTVGPEGLPDRKMGYGADAQHPMAALLGRVGDDGPSFLVGSRLTMKAEEEGTLQLSIALRTNWAATGEFKAEISAETRESRPSPPEKAPSPSDPAPAPEDR